MKKIKRFKKENILVLLFLLQLVFIIIYNLTHMRNAVNMDSCEYLVQVIQIYRQKTLLIQDYYYSTALMLDMPTILAAILYGLVKDVFLAWGMAVDVLVLLLALVIYKLCKDLALSGGHTWLIMLGVFTTYSFGLIEYADMMFINGAIYNLRIMLLLLLIDLVVCCHRKNFSKGNVILYILLLPGLFLCGLSSGLFVVGCCVAPILMYEILHLLVQKKELSWKDFIQSSVLVPMGGMAASCMGIVANRLSGFPASQETLKNLLVASKIPDQIGYNFVGILQLFGWPNEAVSLLDKEGIVALLGVFVAFLVIAAFIVSCFIMFRTENEVHKIYIGMVNCIFLVNVALFSLVDLTYGTTTCEYRYWLVVVVPTMLELGIVLPWLGKKISKNFSGALGLLTLLVLLVINVYHDSKLLQVGELMHVAEYSRAMELVEEEDIDTLFVYSDFYQSRILCAYVPEGVEAFAVTMDADNGHGEWTNNKLQMPEWGNYVKHNGDCIKEEIDNIGMIVSDTTGYDVDFMKARAREVIPVENSDLCILLLDDNLMDFVQGIPGEGSQRSRDYFNQQYILTDMQVDENGWYASGGQKGEILSGAFTAKAAGTYSVKLAYNVTQSAGSTPARLVITRNGEQISSTLLAANQTEVTVADIQLDKEDDYEVIITQDEGCRIALNYIEYSLN